MKRRNSSRLSNSGGSKTNNPLLEGDKPFDPILPPNKRRKKQPFNPVTNPLKNGMLITKSINGTRYLLHETTYDDFGMGVKKLYNVSHFLRNLRAQQAKESMTTSILSKTFKLSYFNTKHGRKPKSTTEQRTLLFSDKDYFKIFIIALRRKQIISLTRGSRSSRNHIYLASMEYFEVLEKYIRLEFTHLVVFLPVRNVISAPNPSFRKVGRPFKDLPKNPRKRAVHSRMNFLKKYFAPHYDHTRKFVKMDYKLSLTEPIFNLGYAFEGNEVYFIDTENNNAKIESVADKIFLKNALGINNADYQANLSKRSDWPSLQEINRFYRSMLNELKDCIQILHKYDDFEKKERHVGLVIAPLVLLARFLAYNPEELVSLGKNLRQVLKAKKFYLKMGNDRYFDSPLFKEPLRYDFNEDLNKITMTIVVGFSHDGGENAPDRSINVDNPDRRVFEYGTLVIRWLADIYKRKKYLPFSILFQDLDQKKVSKIFKNNFDNIMLSLYEKKITIRLTQPHCSNLDFRCTKEYVDIDIFCVRDGVWDKKAGLFYVKLMNNFGSPLPGLPESYDDYEGEVRRSVGYRFDISKDKKHVPFLKHPLVDCMENPSVNNVLDLEELFLGSINLHLLRKDPKRDSLRIPYQLLQDNQLIFLVMHNLYEKTTDNVHNIIADERNIMGTLEDIKKLSIDSNSVRPVFNKVHYQFWTKKNIYQKRNVFKKEDNIHIDDLDNLTLQLRKARNTIEQSKYKVLFLGSVVHEYFSKIREFRVNQTDQLFDNFLKSSEKIFVILFANLMSLCKSMMNDKQIMAPSTVTETIINSDIFYLFVAFHVQITGRIPHYLLEILCTIFYDCFFRRTLAQNSTNQRESQIRLVRKILQFNTSRFHKTEVGKWKIKLRLLLKNEEEEPDETSNTALQVILRLLCCLGNVCYGKPMKYDNEEIEMKKRHHLFRRPNSPQRINPTINLINNRQTRNIFSELEESTRTRLSTFYDMCKEWLRLAIDLKSRIQKLSLQSPFAPSTSLYDIQKECVLKFCRVILSPQIGVLLGWEMGLGKSAAFLQMAYVVLKVLKGISLLVVPSALTTTMRKKVEHWSDVEMVGLQESCHFVYSYDALRNYLFKNSRRGIIVFITKDMFKTLVTVHYNRDKRFWNNNLFRRVRLFLFEEAHLAFNTPAVWKGVEKSMEIFSEIDQKQKTVSSSASSIQSTTTPTIVDSSATSTSVSTNENQTSSMSSIVVRRLHVVVTGTPNRNESVLSNINHFMTGKPVENKKRVEKKMKEYYKFGISGQNLIRPVVQELLDPIKENILFEKAVFEASVSVGEVDVIYKVQKFHVVVYLENTEQQLRYWDEYLRLQQQKQQQSSSSRRTNHLNNEISASTASTWHGISLTCQILPEKTPEEKRTGKRIVKFNPKILVESPKMASLYSLLKKSEGDEEFESSKVIVASRYVTHLTYVQDYLRHHYGSCFQNWKFFKYNGEQSSVKNDTQLGDFKKETDSFSALFLSKKRGSFGIDVTEANVVILLERDFDSTWDSQLVGRPFRRGQERNVKVFSLVCGDVEENIHERGERREVLNKFTLAKGDGGDISFSDEYMDDEKTVQDWIKKHLERLRRRIISDEDECEEDEGEDEVVGLKQQKMVDFVLYLEEKNGEVIKEVMELRQELEAQMRIFLSNNN